MVLKFLNSTPNPKIKPRLNILEPKTLPTAISGLPSNAALTDTANSGAEVPIATIVKPIIKSETPNFWANLLAESISHSAPFQRKTMETTTIVILKKRLLIIIWYIIWFFFYSFSP